MPAPTKNEHLVFIENDKPMTTSRLIAKTFSKQHAHVLRDIQNLNCSEKFTQSNFGLSNYRDKSGKENKEYHVTKDGFTMLAFGYTGPKAMMFKEAYIERFNLMEHELRSKQPETKQIAAQASPYQEETLMTVKMGQYTNQIYITGGVIYARLSPIMKYLGYQSNGGQYIDKIGSDNCKQILVGKWFINVAAFDRLLNLSNMNVPSAVMSSIYRDVFNVGRPLDEHVYHFTAMQMLEIFELIMTAPINKDKVINRLSKGKI